MIMCPCGSQFLAGVIAAHQRSCAACQPSKGEKEGRRSVVFSEENGENNFVPCKLCGRTFLPDRSMPGRSE